MSDLKLELPETNLRPFLFGQTAHVPDRPFDSYRKPSPPRPNTFEIDSVAPGKSLEAPKITRKGNFDLSICT